MTASGRTLQNSEIFFAMSGSIGDLGAADQHVRLDADLAQLADRLLGRLGLQLARRAQEGQQRQVDEHAVVHTDLEAELADGLEERQALDVADRAADLGDRDVGSPGVGAAPARIAILISSVMCGITCTVLPR
jgi:hypothetical protein